MSQRKQASSPTVSQFEAVWRDAVDVIEDPTRERQQDLAHSCGRLLDVLLIPSRLWESGRWVDAVLVGDTKLSDDSMEMVGTAVWGVGGTTAQFVSPVRLKFQKPSSEGSFGWHLLMSNPEPPEPYTSSRQVYDFASPEPNWHLEIFHEEHGALWAQD